MRIGIETFGGELWTGGSVYLINLLHAIRSVKRHDSLELIMLQQQDSEIAPELNSLLDDVIELPHSPQPTIVRRVVRRGLQALHVPTVERNPLAGILNAGRLDAVFGPSDFAHGSHIPWLSWIPDFQHRHLSSMFTSDELVSRDRFYKTIVEDADAVILSSNSAFADFQQFAPEYTHKGKVVSFACRIPEDAYRIDIPSVLNTYHLPERFFYVPNQLWKHKNIETVLDALAILRDSGESVTVVRTGNTSDYRDPNYLSEILSLISSKGVREDVVFLGLIPRNYVFSLMRQAVAVLQPSLFEGWSTSIEECKSLGKRMILSDLPVHREQDPPESVFFSANSAPELAQALRDAWRNWTFGPDMVAEQRARIAAEARIQAFGGQFVQAIAGIARKRSQA